MLSIVRECEINPVSLNVQHRYNVLKPCVCLVPIKSTHFGNLIRDFFSQYVSVCAMNMFSLPSFLLLLGGIQPTLLSD